eukprot:884637-Pyramimonas_sp.AAC.1
MRERSSTRFPAVGRLTVHRRRQFPVSGFWTLPSESYLVELFVIDELEVFRRGVELVPRRALRHR